MPVRTKLLTAAALVAMAFGALTIISGARAMMASGPGVVPFVLWFNFLAGFAYVLAGIGLWRGSRWGVWLSLAIVLATAVVYGAFLLHVWRGGPWMGRTMGAMGLRTLVWAVITVIAFRRIPAWRS